MSNYGSEEDEQRALRTEFIEALWTYHDMKFEELSDETTYGYKGGPIIVLLTNVGEQEVGIEVGSSETPLIISDEIDYYHAEDHVVRLIKAYRELCDA